jgi:hypothetical protein
MSNPRRVSTFVILIALAAVTWPGVAQTPPTPVAVEDLRAVRARVAPDSRLVVFDVAAERRDGEVVVNGEVESAAAREAALEAVRSREGGTVVDRITVLPDAALGLERHALVRVSVANVRRTPAHAAEMVTQAVMGLPVRLLKHQAGWYLVHTEPDEYLGWIEELQLTPVTAEGRQGWEALPRAIVTVPAALVRSAPALDADPVADLVIGALVGSVGRSGPWREVRLPDGRGGFVRDEEVRDYAAWRSSRAPTGEAIARTARGFMGVPYLWGGTSAKGFDCSGFVQTVFRLNGIEMPRDADQQAREGLPVAIDRGLVGLEEGDLLFFGAAATADQPERVTHTAIHIGRLEVVHASGLVRQNSLDPASPIYAPTLRERLLHARRVLPGSGPPPSARR